MEQKINICFLTDEEYVMQTCVAITSILLNKNLENIYDIYILCNNVSYENILKFKGFNQKNFNINIVNLEHNNNYSKYDIKEIPASITAMYKFSIPNILNKLDKVLYLDGDIIVKKDLKKLYDHDIENNYVGAIKEAGGLSKSLFRLYSKKNFFYFNSGVMLMNLKKMREDNIVDKLIDYRMNGYNELMDQDSLNYILREKIYELSFEFNTQLVFAYITQNINKIKMVCKLKNEVNSIDEIIDNAVIIHYSGKKKPWKHYDGIGHDIWVYYYYLSPFKNNILNRLLYNVDNNENRILYFIKNKQKNIRRYKFMKKFIK